MTLTRALAVLVVVALGFGAYRWWSSEERRVRQRIEALAAAASVPANEADLARLARARRFLGGLQGDLRVEFEQEEWPPIVGRDAVAALVARRWDRASEGMTVEIRDLTVSVTADRLVADARFRMRVVSLGREREPVVLDGRTVSLTMRRVNGEWLVASARILRSDDAAFTAARRP